MSVNNYMKKAILLAVLFIIMTSFGNMPAHAADRQQLDWEKNLLSMEIASFEVADIADKDLYEYFVSDAIAATSVQRAMQTISAQALDYCNSRANSIGDVLFSMERNSRIRKDIRPVVLCIKDFAVTKGFVAERVEEEL